MHCTFSCCANDGTPAIIPKFCWQIPTASSNSALSAPRYTSQSSQNGRSSSAQSELHVSGRPPLQSSPASVQHAAVMACERVAMSLLEQIPSGKASAPGATSAPS